ncbi:MAG: response regulator, partial [Proteobacteria bacterium]
ELDFDLIVSDMRMPNKDGQWLLRELRKRQKSFPPFIFMTGFSDLSAQDAFDMGADGFLGKPLNSERLAALLDKLSKTPETRWSKPPKDKASELFSKVYQSSETSSNIKFGRGGMFIRVDAADLKSGERLAFDLHFDSGPIRHLSGVGTVAWRRENYDELSAEYGIEFEYISEDTLPEWLRFLQKSDLVAVIPNSRARG